MPKGRIEINVQLPESLQADFYALFQAIEAAVKASPTLSDLPLEFYWGGAGSD